MKQTKALNPKKYSPLLITLLALAMTVSCRAQAPATSATDEKDKEKGRDKVDKADKVEGTVVASGVVQIGRLTQPSLTESSGVVASRQYPGTFWTHNDGGGLKRQVLYGFTRTGQPKAEFRLVDVLLLDWEDIAIDDARHLYVGDIGNNNERRDDLAVYQVDEPNPANAGGTIKTTRSWRLRYPGARFDCESL